MAQTNVFLLAADNVSKLTSLLQSDPELVTSQDEHGYSLMHAAASYNHIELLRLLAKEYNLDVNIKDEDGETALFVVETVDAARVLITELNADPNFRNLEGQTAEEKIRGEDDYPSVADYLHIISQLPTANAEVIETAGAIHPPPLPPNVSISVGTMDGEAAEAQGQDAVDLDFKRRIEQLAARDDFGERAGQNDLRDLIKDAVREVQGDEERAVRRRMS